MSPGGGIDGGGSGGGGGTAGAAEEGAESGSSVGSSGAKGAKGAAERKSAAGIASLEKKLAALVKKAGASPSAKDKVGKCVFDAF